MISIAILDDFQDAARSMAQWERLQGRASLTVFNDHVAGEALVRRLQPFEVVMLIRERTAMPRALLERLPRLKLLVTAGWRNRAIDLAACKDRGVLVCGTEAGGNSTVELAWGLILALARHIPAEDRALRAGRWQTSLGVGLRGKTLGVLGLGRLGADVARIGLAFGMQVIAWSQNLTPEHAAGVGARRVDKPMLFEASDVLTIHVVLSERTRGLVGPAELARMKPTAVLVNTSRAGIVDTDALVHALQRGTIAGAGLDVYDDEPLPADAPILKAPNTVLTPHLGYVTGDSYRIYFGQALEDIEAWLNGSPIRVMEA
jgi:phosphoglycerate dehydrogenase-like enzyme